MSIIVDSIIRLSLVFILLLSTVPYSFAAEETEDLTEITDVVTEYEPGAYMAQLGDYSIVVPTEIFVDNGNDSIVVSDVSAIDIGSIIKAELSGQDENGNWIASTFTIYLGEGINEALKDLDEDTVLRIKGAIQHIAEAASEGSDSAINQTASTSETTSSANSSESTDLRFENGVWKN